MTYTPNRRRFLIDSGLAALDSTRAFGANDKLRVGVIGVGGRMRQLLDSADSTGVPWSAPSPPTLQASRYSLMASLQQSRESLTPWSSSATYKPSCTIPLLHFWIAEIRTLRSAARNLPLPVSMEHQAAAEAYGQAFEKSRSTGSPDSRLLLSHLNASAEANKYMNAVLCLLQEAGGPVVEATDDIGVILEGYRVLLQISGGQSLRVDRPPSDIAI